MKIGMVGLGKMGGNMAARLGDAGHEVVGYDAAQRRVRRSARWPTWWPRSTRPGSCGLMVPSGDPTQQIVSDELAGLLAAGDVVVDGGNSNWHDSVRRGEALAERGIGFVDCGTSGGVWGRDEGYCLMVGGDARARRRRPAAVRRAAPARGRVRPRRAGRHRPLHQDGPQRHRVRAHAGLRRGLRAAGPVRPRHRRRRRPGRLAARVGGAVVAARPAGAGAAAGRPTSTASPAYAKDSGEGRWTVQEAIERGVATPVISAALYARFVSQHDDSIAMKAIAALRNQFGGHAVLAESERPRATSRSSRRAVVRVPDADPAATRWCCSAPPATWPTRRSSRPSTPWSATACAACRSSAWPRPTGTTTSSASGPTTPSSSARATTSTRSSWKSSPAGCRYVSGDYREASTFENLAEQLAASSGRCSTWPSRRRCSTTSCRGWPRVGLNGPDSRGGGREAVRPRPGVGGRAERGAPPGVPRGGDLPHRPLPRARSRSRTCWCSGSPTRCSSRCGTATTCRSVQITMAESFGVEGRGRFYESVGALRDVFQNHLLQVIALLAMEPPVSADENALRDEKVRLWRQIRRDRPQPRWCAASTGATSTSPASRRAATSRRSWPSSSRSSRGAGPACRGWCARARSCRSPPPRPSSRSPPRPGCCSARPGSARPDPNRLRFRLGHDDGVTLQLQTKAPGDELVSRPVDLEVDLRGAVRRTARRPTSACSRTPWRRPPPLRPGRRRRGAVAHRRRRARRPARRSSSTGPAPGARRDAEALAAGVGGWIEPLAD